MSEDNSITETLIGFFVFLPLCLIGILGMLIFLPFKFLVGCALVHGEIAHTRRYVMILTASLIGCAFWLVVAIVTAILVF